MVQTGSLLASVVVCLAAYIAVYKNYTFSAKLMAVPVAAEANAGEADGGEGKEIDRVFTILKDYAGWSDWNPFTYNVQVVDDSLARSDCRAGDLCAGHKLSFTVNMSSMIFKDSFDVLELTVRGTRQSCL